MLELLERQTDLTVDHRKIAAGTGSLEDLHHDRGASSRDRATPRDGDDGRVTFSLVVGHWPRVFPGL